MPLNGLIIIWLGFLELILTANPKTAEDLEVCEEFVIRKMRSRRKKGSLKNKQEFGC